MSMNELKQAIEQHFAAGAAAATDPAAREAFLSLRTALEAGEARAAEPDPSSPTGWRVNAWVKQGILLGFRVGVLQALPSEGLSFVDRDTFPIRRFGPGDGVRIVPGGSSIRAGAYLAR